ncbi:MAG: helix-turn-helix transcriptional regulator [Defluviicoccus sp.]
MNINPDTLKFHRERCGLSQEALADVSKVSKKTISRIERDEIRKPRRNTTKQLAQTLGIAEEALCQPPEKSLEQEADASESAYRKLTTHLSPDANLAFAFVEERYGASSEDLIEIAPLLFTIVAEASLNWRREKIKQAEDAFDRLSRIGAAFPHLAFCGGPRREEDMLGIEDSCIEQQDVFGSRLRAEARGFRDMATPGNPFIQYVALLAAKHAPALVEIEQFDASQTLPSYMIRTAKIERLTGGDDRARYALARGHALKRDIPAELQGDEKREQRIAWLAQRVPAEEWEKHQKAKSAPSDYLAEIGI